MQVSCMSRLQIFPVFQLRMSKQEPKHTVRATLCTDQSVKLGKEVREPPETLTCSGVAPEAALFPLMIENTIRGVQYMAP